jgi:4-methyl-5(b-hydroxyethyl)-thiazole monophosphate biosynthesis
MTQVLVPLAEGCEELEAVTIIDLLRRAGIEVITASLTDELTLTASRQTRLVADYLLDEVINREFDMVILPGGQPGTLHLIEDARITQLLKQHFDTGKWLCAICAAPSVFAHAGLLDNVTITYYPGTIDPSAWPAFSHSQAAIVIDPPFITSRSPGTAIEFALTLISQLKGEAVKNKVKLDLKMEP